MSNYCACSGGDEEYTIELNQQGPEGPQGPVGPEGFSPSISVKTNTDKAYILTVVNKEGNFDTPNLYGELEKLNADLSNIPNPALINGISLSSIEDNIPMITMDSSRITTNVDGNLILNATASNEETMEVSNYEVVVNPRNQRLELHDNEGNIKVVAVTDEIAIVQSQLSDKLDKATYEADKATYATKEELASTNATVTNLQTSVASNTNSIGTLREDLSNLETTVGNNSADIAALDADKLASANIIAGANITIDRNGNNLTINSIGGGGSGAAIDDSSTSSASTWSSSKINSIATELSNTKNDNIFDISKFTIVGSPTITDDGIASGFSSSNLIYKDVDLDNKSFVIETPVYSYTQVNSSADQWLINLGTYNNKLYLNARILTSGKISIGIQNDDKILVSDSNTTAVVGNTYQIKFVVNTSKAEIYLSTNGGEYVLVKSANNTDLYTLNNNILNISNAYYLATNPFLGSIDLKQFSITVDGEVVFNGLMESTKPIYDKITSTSTALSTFQTDTDNNFSAVNSALNEKANLSDLAGYVTVNKYNELLARVVALETEINGGNA